MRKLFFFFHILIFVLISIKPQLIAAAKEPYAIKGVIDLRQTARNNTFILNLNGEWEFYWKKMLHPHDFTGQKPIHPDFYGTVPSYWTDYHSDSMKTTRSGYATYRLRVLLPSGFRNSLAFNVPVFDSSYDLYIGGKFIGGNGSPGRTESETRPGYARSFFRFNPVNDTVEIIINVSNFHHRRGGFWLPLKIGTFNEVQKEYASTWARDWATISFLIGFALLFLFFFLLFARDNLMAYFSIATIGLALRPMFTSNYLINNLLTLSWFWIVRFEYIGLYLVLAGSYWFVVTLYPSRLFKILTWINTAIFSAAALLTMFLSVRVFSYIIVVYYPMMIILMIYSLAQSLRGALKKNIIDMAYFCAFAILSYGGLHDLRVSLGRSTQGSGYILNYFLVLFVFIQAVLLLYKWVRAYSEKEKLQKEFEFVNRNLEMLVDERTQEINKRKEEIESQNTKIAIQNKQLSDTIQLKNKIFSVIAHDLRSPVVNILYMLNLLKEDEYKEKYDTFANSSIQYAQQVISLLENMLVWGRGQEDKIKFSPEKRDLSDIILTNMSIFKETADKKEISVNFTQIGNSKAYFDKDLLDIIIRNLLSNSVKYTPRGGRISILLKDKTHTNEGVVLKICDNGIGIPVQKQEHLFTSAEVESTPGTENEKGTGFGLKLCYELVKLNNGTISVDSKDGEGTCFTITLPEDKNSTPGKNHENII